MERISLYARLWRAIARRSVNADMLEITPHKMNDISAMVAPHFRIEDPAGFSDLERKDHENLATLRNCLYPER